MALSITHPTVVVVPDDPAYPVGSDEWNAAHTITMATGKILGRTTAGAGAVEELSTVPLANGGTAAVLTDPNADRIMFWDDSAGAIDWLTAGSGLTITGTTMTAAASPAGSDTQVQFNDGGAFGGDAGITYNKTTDALSVGGFFTTNATLITNATATFGGSGNGRVSLAQLPTATNYAGLFLLTSITGSNYTIVQDTTGGDSNLYINAPSNGTMNLNIGGGASVRIGSAIVLVGPAHVFSWDGDTGLARVAAGVVEVNNGTAGSLRWIVDAGKKRVSSQFDKTSDTTLANITGLSVTVIAGRTYQFEAVLFTTSNSSGGVKAAIAGTATATAIIYEGWNTDANVDAGQTRATALGTAVAATTAVTAARITIKGLITVNAAGTLTVQFAQNASNGTASSVLVGSYFIVQDIP